MPLNILVGNVGSGKSTIDLMGTLNQIREAKLCDSWRSADLMGTLNRG